MGGGGGGEWESMSKDNISTRKFEAKEELLEGWERGFKPKTLLWFKGYVYFQEQHNLHVTIPSKKA